MILLVSLGITFGFFLFFLCTFASFIIIDVWVPLRRSIPAKIAVKSNASSRLELLDIVGGILSGVRSPRFRLIIQVEGEIGSVYVKKSQHEAALVDADILIDYRLGRFTKNLYIEKLYI
ncbi:MAG: hypothetical protein ACM3PZ_03725 [Bacillota bacterium]